MKVQITGAGPAGLSAAIAFAKRGWTVCISSRLPLPSQTERIDVLDGSASPILSRLGISLHESPSVARLCPGVWSHWDAAGPTARDHLRSPHGPSWSVDRRRFNALLVERALSLGAKFVDHGEPADWRIVASGGLRARGQGQIDDRLIALVARMENAPAGQDSRLLIEAVEDGWCYFTNGPNESAVLGVITDSLILSRRDPARFALDTLRQTSRIADCCSSFVRETEIRAIPIECGKRPYIDHESLNTIRIGDALAMHDPISGRGLWEAIKSGELVAATITNDQTQLPNVMGAVSSRYERYLVERSSFYRLGYERFAADFWRRRLTQRTSSSRERSQNCMVRRLSDKENGVSSSQERMRDTNF